MKRKAKMISPQERIEMDKKRSHEERIIQLLKLMRLSNLVSEAGAKYRKR